MRKMVQHYMKLILLLSTICSVIAFKRRDSEEYGPFAWAWQGLIKCKHHRNQNLDVSETTVYFYDFENHNILVYGIDCAGNEILNIRELDKNRKFIVYVPGYKSYINKETVVKVREAFQDLRNTYLIIIDHNAYTNDNHGLINSYKRAVQHVYYIGKALADMLATITQNGVSPKNIHCIGHSLGAQILGHTGDIFFEKTGQKLAKVTGLDPAGPCFSKSPVEEQLRSGVADYVEVYHCNAGALGTTSVLGDVDFFANKKGSSQPECGTPVIPGIIYSAKAARCNHGACLDFYLATIRHPDWFPATACRSYRQYKRGICWFNDKAIAGFWNPGTAKGIYYFSTNEFDINV